MSIVSVFAVMLMVMLLGMVMNAGREVDGKIRMQNAADAVAYSGGLVLARGMNSLAFTNNLLCEIFALAAFMEEASQGNAQKLISETLEAWKKVGQTLSGAGSSCSIAMKFTQLGIEILSKVQPQQTLVNEFGTWAQASSTSILPVLQTILSSKLIPEFQKTVVQNYPDIAQMAALEVAKQNGTPDHGRGQMYGAIWKPDGTLVAATQDGSLPTLPVVDPTGADGAAYKEKSRWQRYEAAFDYLRKWNQFAFQAFALTNQSRMNRFHQLWESYTFAHLEKLLEDSTYGQDNNMLMMIRSEGVDPYNAHPSARSLCANPSYPGSPAEFNPYDSTNRTDAMRDTFTVVGVVYWKGLSEMGSTFMRKTLFNNPATNDAIAFAQVRFFLPRKRRVWRQYVPTGPNGQPLASYWNVVLDESPEKWSLMSENWTTQLVPTTGADLTSILTKQPTLPGGTSFDLKVLTLGSVSNQELESISPH